MPVLDSKPGKVSGKRIQTRPKNQRRVKAKCPSDYEVGQSFGFARLKTTDERRE